MLSTPHFKRDDADDTLLATTLAEDRPFADSGSSLTSLIEYIQRQAPSYSTTSSEQQPFLPNSNSPSAHEMESYEPLASTMGGQGGGGTGSGLTTSTITMTARSANGLLMVLLPLLIVLSTLLFLLLSFLIFVLILRKKQGIKSVPFSSCRSFFSVEILCPVEGRSIYAGLVRSEGEGGTALSSITHSLTDCAKFPSSLLSLSLAVAHHLPSLA
jgi:hypothetical protein